MTFFPPCVFSDQPYCEVFIFFLWQLCCIIGSWFSVLGPLVQVGHWRDFVDFAPEITVKYDVHKRKHPSWSEPL